MKTSFCVLILFISIFNTSFSQNYNWITPNKTYLKMSVREDGILRINKVDFVNAGINTSTIDPRTIKIFNKGIQVPIYFFGEQDGTFDDLDYFDFYGSRNYGGNTITYDQNNLVAYITNEYFNQYSDTNFYWADWGGSNGLRFSTSNYTTLNIYPTEFFYETLHFEKDRIYSQGENVSSSDLRFLSTEKFKGEGWYWTLLGSTQTISDTFSTPLLFSQPVNATIRVFAYSQNREIFLFNEHRIEVSINGTTVTNLFINDINRIDTLVSFSSALLSNISVNTVTLKYISTPGFEGAMYVDLFEVKFPKIFKFRDHHLNFTLNSDTTSKLFRISGYNFPNSINVYDVNNNIRITNFTNNFDSLKFTGKSNGKFELINNIITKKPFRIVQRQVPNLVSNSNGVDYLIIYHSLFQSQAEQLRAYRQSNDNFRSFKANIEDVYDIFNYGLENPLAIRNFIKHISDTWQLPKIKYICLFGRGSLDPKKHSASSVYYNNLIPVYGNPPSDGYFANLNLGTFFYNDQISIGRLPAYYVAEAQTMVDKIIAYESEPPDKWWKTFSYITGGGTLPEQLSHQQVSNFEIGALVIPPPISGESHKIYRTDESGSQTFNFADSIKNDINRGTSYVNYRGHAGSHDWEVGMQNPNVLNNGNKLPLILSLTCFTGENSKAEFRGFGEKFIYLSGKGAIGFISTTGWSYASQGNNLGLYVLQTMVIDTTRRMGELLKVAGQKFALDSLQFAVRHTVNCYNLLGDPAVKLKLPRAPEFVINNTDYTISNELPVIGEPLSLKIYPKNYGLFADSCKIRFQLKKNNQNYSHKDTVYKAFRYLDTILYNFKLDSAGVYHMVVTLDQDNWYPLENENNNSITINIPFKSNSFLPLSPINNSVIFQDSVEFAGLNPNISFIQNSIRIILQLDTTKFFNSPMIRTFINSNLQGPVTKFKAYIPSLNNKLYYWRTNSIINNDTSGWSKIQTFIYNNGQISDRYINENISVSLLKDNSNQYSQSDFNNTYFTGQGIKLQEYPANLFVRSYGSNAEESSYFSVGNSNIYIDGGRNAGINMLKVKKVNGNILEFKNLKMLTDASSDSVVTFLNTFDNTHYLMLLNASHVPGFTYFTEPAKVKLRQFGSIYCDSIGLLGYFHTWSLIGSLGATSSQVSEMFDPCCRPMPSCTACDHWTQSTSSMNVVFKRTSGTVSNVIGPAKIWTDFSWSRTLVSNSSITFDVIGIDRNEQQTVLFSDIQTNNFVDLSTINAYQFPKLNLLAKLNIDTAIGTESPFLTSLKVSYSPASELILDKNSLQVKSSTERKDLLNFSFNYHNAGFNFLPGIIVNVYNGSISDSDLVLTDTVSSILKFDSSKNYSNNLVTPSFRDSTRMYIYIKPKGNNNEFYVYNNSADFNLTSSKVYHQSVVEVLGDGQKLNNGDYIRKNPEIKVSISGNVSLPSLSDTTKIALKLNNKNVPYHINETLNKTINVIGKDNSHSDNNISLYYYPVLEIGTNKLSIIYKDNSDNLDTVSYDVLVSNELMIKDLNNYPNPMKIETNFIFNLAGSTSPNSFKIKLYTVSGRLIKEINYPVNIGYNKIFWDGRDDDGDFVANGTYLYKLIIEGESKVETQIQKLVVLR